MQRKYRTLLTCLAMLIVLLMIPIWLIGRTFARSHADEDLLAAVRTGDAGRALTALNAGANPNLRGYLYTQPSEAPWESMMRLMGFQKQNMKSYDPQNMPTLLALAEIGRRPQIVHLLLTRGADPNLVRQNGVTPLMEAAAHGPAETIHELIQYGAKVDLKAKDGSTAFSRAIVGNHIEAVKAFLHEPDAVKALGGKNATLEFVLRRPALARVEIVRPLLEMGADADQRTLAGVPMICLASTATYYGPRFFGGLPTGSGGAPLEPSHIDAQALLALLNHGARIDAADADGMTPLMLAARDGDEGAVRFLLDRHASVAARSRLGQTPLHHAAMNFNEASVRLLLDHHAEIDAQDKDGCTPLFFAAPTAVYRNGRRLPSGVVKQLLARHARIDLANQLGETPLIAVARNGNVENLRLLLAAGADVRRRNTAGETALIASTTRIPQMPPGFMGPSQQFKAQYHEIWGPYVETVRRLLQRGADVNARDGRGQSALSIAKQRNCQEIIDLLTKAGAR